MTTTSAHSPRALPKINFGSTWLSLALIALMIIYPFVFGKNMNWGIATLIFAGLALSWNILGGWTGQESFGHAALAGVGAYTLTLLAIHYQIAPWWGALIGMALATLLSLGWGWLTFRLRGAYFTLSSIAIALLIRIYAINDPNKFTGGSEGLFMPDLPTFFGLDLFDRRVEYWLAFAFVLLVLLITHVIRRSRLGYALLAVREDEESARALGINPLRMKMTAFAISAALTALGGCIYAIYLQAFEPHTLLELPLSIQIALMAIIGGRSSIQGPILGAIVILGLGELTRSFLGEANLLIYGFLILIVTLFAPGGIMGLFNKTGAKLGKAR
ncbi:branched-chain amino acid ABC transporter permease [Deinococcus peraridilitoris]|uniref:ABC-type branched-chain amino acid transport system, permease component n=1 Tax=Deinococcus peraridilitoris (strain DSM 19664 / LMG 22246 / CIP 109416 / KR-200) TaxID=937777 RepID=K9ZZ07_DEIPD|nr:branched-chain amino acid ABC transporter permease [Deinococcus peraridilitoris]AFZ66439.1 ABC-type branched-chain amino acid transport system, permease component [Deinococcus peraridilitoris DSM 19664]